MEKEIGSDTKSTKTVQKIDYAHTFLLFLFPWFSGFISGQSEEKAMFSVSIFTKTFGCNIATAAVVDDW